MAKQSKELDPDYKQWLKDTDGKDSKLNREWFFCPMEQRADFMKQHRDFFRRR